MQEVLPWIILFLPLAAAVVITLFTQADKEFSSWLSIGAIGAAFVGSCFLFLLLPPAPFETPERIIHWIDAGTLKIQFRLLVDHLSALMLLVVTGVGFLIHLYSRGYMAEDRSVARYFASLSLFTCSMLGIVLANNFVMMFIFWELVGVSSYLLIGFWFEKPAAADAAKKAFITNRLGDFGFLLGMIVIWATLSTHNTDALSFEKLAQILGTRPDALGGLATLAGLLIFCGAVGKSAQFPLHVWLPDAMEGPTPVSALIHAATMVAAGVYMLCRVFFLLDLPGSCALEVIAWIGGITALLAALMAIQQNDIKRILAYSTLSQLGYMVMAVGFGGETAGMFHLTTHAFFKALMFLGAGSVILACHHEQDIWKMGGLREKLPTTWWTFAIGTLALCGVWPLSGFYSKDSILAAALDDQHHNYALFIIAVAVAALTTFYMFRLVFVAFLGGHRSDAAHHAHESPGVMTWPLRLLAVASVLAGFWGLEQFIGVKFAGAHGEHAPHALTFGEELFAPFNHNILAALAGLLAVIAGFALAFALYREAAKDPLPEKLGWLSRAMRDRFYFDEIYAWFIGASQEALAKIADWFDRWIIAGLMVRGTHGTTEFFGRALRLMQTGNLQTYAFLFAAGVLAVVAFVKLTGGHAH